LTLPTEYIELLRQQEAGELISFEQLIEELLSEFDDRGNP
jgi:hypothetical protein